MLGEEHRGLLEGSQYRVEKLQEHLNGVRFQVDDFPDKLDGLIFACGMLRDIVTNVLTVLLAADQRQDVPSL
jgi:hypothetical protein